MRRLLAFLLPLFCMVLLLPAAPAAAAEVPYWELGDSAYFFDPAPQLSSGRAAQIALYLREIHAYAGFETYILLPAGGDAEPSPERFGENAIVLRYDKAAGEAAVFCGAAADAVLTAAQCDRITAALLDSSAGGTDARICAALTALTHILFDDAQPGVPETSYLSSVVSAGAPLQSAYLPDSTALETNGLLSERDTAQLTYLVHRRSNTRVVLLPAGSEKDVLAEVERILLGLQQSGAPRTSVYVCAMESGLLGFESGQVRSLYEGSDPAEPQDAAAALIRLFEGTYGPVEEPAVPPSRRGILIVGGAMLVLVAVFAVALRLRSQAKARKNEPIRPSFDINRHYPDLADRIEPPAEYHKTGE